MKDFLAISLEVAGNFVFLPPKNNDYGYTKRINLRGEELY